jgi:hypothetical protein
VDEVAEKHEAYVAGPPPVSLLEISRVLEETARLLRLHPGCEASSGEPDERITAARVRRMIAARWLRREYFGFDPGDAAWAMMLELFAARLEGRRIYQTRLGIAAGVAQTTAFTITRRLLESGLFVAGEDSEDKRLVLIGLSDEAARALRAYLLAIQEITPFPA